MDWQGREGHRGAFPCGTDIRHQDLCPHISESNETLPEMQKKLLIAIAKEGKASQVTSIAFCKKHFLKSPSSVQSALRVLHDRGGIQKEGETYSLPNRLLEIWLVNEY